MSDNPLLKTPGELINEAREAQDLTIAQLSERTKIPPPVLNALELDEYHKISGPLYIKSFLRTCAVDLGLDPQTVLSLYNKISGERKPGATGSEMVWDEEEVQISRVGLPWMRIILIVGMAVVLVGLGLFVLRGCGDGDSAGDQEVSLTGDPPSPGEPVVAEVQGDSLESGVPRHESLINTRTEEDLKQRTAAREEMGLGGIGDRDTKSDLPDTLALGWLTSPPPAVAVVDDLPAAETPAEIPARRDTGDGPDSIPDEDTEVITGGDLVETTPVVIESTAAEVEIETTPQAPESVAQVDSDWPLVLQIVCDAPQEILVRRDGDAAFSEVRWPGPQETAPAVPAAGFEAGRAYGRDGRLVVFWGAYDHFSLKLARVRGVEIFVNDRVRDIGRLRPGQELILDAHAAGSSERR